MTTVAVVLAGGTGRRMGSALPKQLIEAGGRPLLAYSVETFDSHPGIDAVLVVMAAGWRAEAERITAPYGSVRAVIEGGETRSDSTVAALAALAGEPDDTLVLFHDAARPFVDHAIIDRCLDALKADVAVAVGQPLSDTVVEIAPGPDKVVTDMPSRESLRRFQTPQAFRLDVLRRAYAAALDDAGFTATDDCGVVYRYLPGTLIQVVEGAEHNLKVTHPLDLVVAEHLARERAQS